MAGDLVDLVPIVTGVGEATRALKGTIQYGDDLIDVANSAKQAFKDGTGVYEIFFESGKNYVGKGGFQRMIDSGKRIVEKYGDEIASMMWKSADNDVDAFIGEYILQAARGVLSGNDCADTYNKIWSPGRKFFRRLFE